VSSEKSNRGAGAIHQQRGGSGSMKRSGADGIEIHDDRMSDPVAATRQPDVSGPGIDGSLNCGSVIRDTVSGRSEIANRRELLLWILIGLAQRIVNTKLAAE